MATNEQYWQERIEAHNQAVWKSEDEVQKELAELYKEAMSDLQKELEAFAGKYDMTLENLRKKADRASIKNFDTKLVKLLEKARKGTINKREIKQLEMLRLKFAITRLDLLINAMELRLIQLYSDVQITMEEHLKATANESYYMAAGLVANFARLPEDDLLQIIHTPWSGADFADSIWEHKELLLFNLRKIVQSGIAQGKGIPEMSRKLRDATGQSMYAAERVIRTETNYVMTESTAKGYEDNGLEKYQFKVNRDSKACKICLALGDKVFLLKDRQPGKNIPPVHPHDRCYIIPVIDEE